MMITIKTAVTFQLPEEIKQMEKFESNNRDWVPEVISTSTATFKRTQIFEVGGDTE